jgi:hypothetical protein
MSDVDKFLDTMRQKQFPDKHVYFHDYIKWYTDDAVIRTVQEAVKNLDENTFIRVGEDSDDIEWWGGCPDTEWLR